VAMTLVTSKPTAKRELLSNKLDSASLLNISQT
jgi:hypothetical protein